MASSPVPSPFPAELGAFCREIGAETAAWERALPPSAHAQPAARPACSTPQQHRNPPSPSLRGGESGLDGQDTLYWEPLGFVAAKLW